MPQPVPGRYGVLLLNMGGPSNLEEVGPYIYNLLADPDMVRLPLAGLLQRPFARMVARRRAPKVQRRYAQIGGSSPILRTTEQQARLVAAELGAPVACAMRYTPPQAGDALQELAAQGCDRFVAITLYPQYSTVSTLSSIKDLQAQSGGRAVRVVDRHSDNAQYIAAMRANLEATLARAAQDIPTRVLFTAHSIPESYIRRGDPYAAEIEQTAAAIIRGLPAAPGHALAYQSQVGPVKWRGPTLGEALADMVRDGVQQVVVQPLSFVADNLETLYDLDIVFRQQCHEAGIREFHRVPALNDSPLYAATLAGLVREEIRQWEAADA